MSSQLHLLHSLLAEARSILASSPPSSPAGQPAWTCAPSDPDAFTPSLPSCLSLDFSIVDASIIFHIRVLELVDRKPDFGERFALAIGAQRRLEHDEMVGIWNYRGDQVRVKEKVRLESADPGLMSLAAKVGALEHGVEMARKCLDVVMGVEEPDDD